MLEPVGGLGCKYKNALEVLFFGPGNKVFHKFWSDSKIGKS